MHARSQTGASQPAPRARERLADRVQSTEAQREGSEGAAPRERRRPSQQHIYHRVTERDLAPTLRFAERLAAIGKAVWVRYVLVPGD